MGTRKSQSRTPSPVIRETPLPRTMIQSPYSLLISHCRLLRVTHSYRILYSILRRPWTSGLGQVMNNQRWHPLWAKLPLTRMISLLCASTSTSQIPILSYPASAIGVTGTGRTTVSMNDCGLLQTTAVHPKSARCVDERRPSGAQIDADRTRKWTTPPLTRHHSSYDQPLRWLEMD